MYDCIIIGAGPAGLTAGIYLLRANLKVLILEKETIGGQISSSPLVENYPGFKSISGIELANNLYEQYNSLNGELELEEVLKITPGKIKKIKTDMGEYETKSIIIATGARHRLLGLDHELDLIGHGISFCTTCDGAFFKGKTVAVIGGGNTAVTNAIYLSALCKKVYLIHRRDTLKCESTLLDKLKEIDNIEVIYNRTVAKLLGEDELKGIILDDNTTLDLEGMFLSIGMDANTNIVDGLLELSSNKYILSTDTKTKCEGIFVAGDCRDKQVRQLTTATSDGTIAATLAIEYLR